MIAKHPGQCRPHEFQDATYGVGFRVMNPVKTSNNEVPAYRCTVCAPPKVPMQKRGGIYKLNELVVLRR